MIDNKIKGRLGFGCMRLPMDNNMVDEKQFCSMIDAFMAGGFNYFDTAHIYINGQSEILLRKYLTERYTRESFFLADKLSTVMFRNPGGVRPVFEAQLKACGTNYFDCYLMHSQNSNIYGKFKRCRAYETATELLEEGKIRHLGLSFHDTPQLLEQILDENPQIEVVQIQLNYLDIDDPCIQSRKCYDICMKYGKRIIVMEPVKGGALSRDLPPEAEKIIEKAGIAPAELAIRYAAGFDGVDIVLSGMSSINQINENIAFMKNFRPLSTEMTGIAHKVAEVLHTRKDHIPCTACGYCKPGCPRNIAIPELFACLNSHNEFPERNAFWYYSNVYTVSNGKASSCIGCGQCSAICPQHLDIPALLKITAGTLEIPGRKH